MQYKVKKSLVIQKLDDKVVIFDGDRSILYTLNETASYIFNKLKNKIKKQKIIELVATKYRITKEKAENDVEKMIEDMFKKKIVR